VAIIVNNRTTRENLDSQERATRDALAAQAQNIRDERVWEKRIHLYEQVSEWSDECAADVRALKWWWYEPAARQPPPHEDLASSEWTAAGDDVQAKHWPRYVELRSLVNLYGEDAVRTAFHAAVPHPHPTASRPFGFDAMAESIQRKDELLVALQETLRTAINKDNRGVDSPK
jgi:hypothetical protein